MLAIGSDHGGFALKQELLDYLKEQGIPVHDYGCYDTASVDYPDIAKTVCEAVLDGRCERGILVCGTGLGMSIAANKVRGIRAAQVCDAFSARMAREHNNAQIITLGGRVVGPELAKTVVSAYLQAEFAGGRHELRLQKIANIEEQR